MSTGGNAAYDGRDDETTPLGGVAAIFAYLIWEGWPNTATWVIGLYVGINMIYFGTSLIFTAIAARGIDTATGSR